MSRMVDEALRWSAAIKWLRDNGIRVVVFDMDHTMSGAHCGSGQLRSKLNDYVSLTSMEFVSFARALAAEDFKLAVATGSDPAEYDLYGQSRETHICAGDLATVVINKHCPEILEKFKIMVGYDNSLHGKEPENAGKRYHMRKIAEFYQVSPSETIIIDDHPKNLVNEDGWLGIRVQAPKVGFQHSDLESYIVSQTLRKVVIVPGNGCVPIRGCNFYGWAEKKLKEKKISVMMAPESGMPDPNLARKEIWLPYIKDTLHADERSVLIGHSSGAVAGLRYAETNQLQALILIAAYDDPLGDANEKLSGYFEGDFDWEKIKANCKHIIQYAGAKDCLVPIAIQRRVSEKLAPKVQYIEIADEDHFFPPPFEDLVRQVLRCVREAV